MSEHDPIDWDELDAETQHELVSLAEKLGGRTASRREFLGAITAAGLGGSLLSQGADRAFEDFVNPASAGTQSVAQFGEAGEPFDFVAEDIYGPGGQGSGDPVNFESVSANALSDRDEYVTEFTDTAVENALATGRVVKLLPPSEGTYDFTGRSSPVHISDNQAVIAPWGAVIDNTNSTAAALALKNPNDANNNPRRARLRGVRVDGGDYGFEINSAFKNIVTQCYADGQNVAGFDIKPLSWSLWMTACEVRNAPTGYDIHGDVNESYFGLLTADTSDEGIRIRKDGGAPHALTFDRPAVFSATRGIDILGGWADTSIQNPFMEGSTTGIYLNDANDNGSGDATTFMEIQGGWYLNNDTAVKVDNAGQCEINARFIDSASNSPVGIDATSNSSKNILTAHGKLSANQLIQDAGDNDSRVQNQVKKFRSRVEAPDMRLGGDISDNSRTFAYVEDDDGDEFYRQRISGATTVSTSAETVFFTDSNGPAEVQVVGRDGNNAKFIDTLLFFPFNSPSVSNSIDVNSPSARTYTESGNSLQLKMGSGTYNVISQGDELFLPAP